MKFLKAVLFFFFVGVISNLSAQTTGDFRSTGNGADDNWTTLANWEYYNGTSWVAAPYYPGNGATNDVYIIDNHTIRLNTNINNLINSITIGDQNGTATSISTLLVGVNGNNTYSLNTNQISILYDGLMKWDGNNTLILPTGTSIGIEKTSPYNPTTVLGTNYGLYEDGNCSTPMEIVIGGVLYSNCNGKGGSKPPSFEDINDGGGNLSVSPTSNSPVCLGDTVNLSANPGGTESDSVNSYTWTVTPPSNTTYSLPSGTDTASDNPTETGTYLYHVTATANGTNASNTISVEVVSCNKTVITNRRITYRVKK